MSDDEGEDYEGEDYETEAQTLIDSINSYFKPDLKPDSIILNNYKNDISYYLTKIQPSESKLKNELSQLLIKIDYLLTRRNGGFKRTKKRRKCKSKKRRKSIKRRRH